MRVKHEDRILVIRNQLHGVHSKNEFVKEKFTKAASSRNCMLGTWGKAVPWQDTRSQFRQRYGAAFADDAPQERQAVRRLSPAFAACPRVRVVTTKYCICVHITQQLSITQKWDSAVSGNETVGWLERTTTQMILIGCAIELRFQCTTSRLLFFHYTTYTLYHLCDLRVHCVPTTGYDDAG